MKNPLEDTLFPPATCSQILQEAHPKLHAVLAALVARREPRAKIMRALRPALRGGSRGGAASLDLLAEGAVRHLEAEWGREGAVEGTR